MIWLKKKIYLFISLVLLSCGNPVSSEKETPKKLDYTALTYDLQIGADMDSVKQNLADLGLTLDGSKYRGKVDQLDAIIQISGGQKLGFWKISWSGNKQAIQAFTKQLENVLKTKYSGLQMDDNYYATTFRSRNTEVILECIIWEDKIELINR